jgi:membrane protein DedA with SNARE-associated domain
VPFDFSQPLGLWAYILLFIVVLVEGPVATLAASVAASSGIMNPYAVFFVASGSNALADIMFYLLGRVGKIEWLLKYERFTGLNLEKIQRLEKDIYMHAPKLLFISKLTLGFSIPTLMVTGMLKVPLKRWLWALITAETIWSGSLVVLGYYFGQYMRTLERGVQIVALIASLVFVIAVVLYFHSFRRRLAKTNP